MRFAYLSSDFGVFVFGTGGSSVHLREVARALRRLGHEVAVFSPTARVEDNVAGYEGFHFVPLGEFAAELVQLLEREDAGLPEHLVREWRRLLYSEYVQRALLPALAEFRPDVMYERYSLFSYAGIDLARQLQIPLILEVNAPLAFEGARYRDLVLKRTAEGLERRILTAADAVVVVSRPLEDHARRLGVPSERISILPTAVEPDRFHPGVSGEAVRSRYKLDGKRVVGFVGSLKPWHDLDTLLAAAGLLAGSDDRFHLLVVGQGPRMEELQARGDGYVTWTGAVEHGQVPEHLAAMDVIVTPYPRDGEPYFSPLKLFEAMAMGKPAVAAPVGQVAEVVVDGENGLLYEPGDPHDLAKKIREIFDRPDRGSALGDAARESVIARHTWERNARQVARIAESLLEKAKA